MGGGCGEIDLLNFSREELIEELQQELSLPSFRATQLINWIYRRRMRDFSQMTDISKSVREALAERYQVSRPELASKQQSSDGTRKYAFRMQDGSVVESVLIAQATRWTLCISSQCGCAIGCTFCRTGTMGLLRNLSTAEILGQVLSVQDDIAESQLAGEPNAPEEFQNIVFMGMGEPLQNLKNVMRAVWLLNDNIGINLSSRKITVSTSGIVPAIRKFGEAAVPANLAISLNATTDEVREKIMPINKRWPIADLLDALRSYPLKARRRITIEYVMLRGVNDSPADLQRLPQLLKGIPTKINLIPYNENAGLGFKSPSEAQVLKWQSSLLDRGMNSTIRWSKGVDIDAACGQLASKP